MTASQCFWTWMCFLSFPVSGVSAGWLQQRPPSTAFCPCPAPLESTVPLPPEGPSEAHGSLHSWASKPSLAPRKRECSSVLYLHNRITISVFKPHSDQTNPVLGGRRGSFIKAPRHSQVSIISYSGSWSRRIEVRGRLRGKSVRPYLKSKLKKQRT